MFSDLLESKQIGVFSGNLCVLDDVAGEAPDQFSLYSQYLRIYFAEFGLNH